MSYNPSARGTSFQGSSRQTGTGYQNGYGSTLTKATPVSTNTSGLIVPLDPSNEALVLAIVGLCSVDIPNAAIGEVFDNGRLENITTSFAIGDPVWAGKTPGTLTNVKPSIGVGSFLEGDFVIFLGAIVENEFNPSQKDIKLMISLVGQL